MALPSEIKRPLERVLCAIKNDRRILCLYPKSLPDDMRITAENLSDLAGNHLFDDQPQLFMITRDEGWIIRSYFQRGSFDSTFSFVDDLHEEFPQILEQEREEYLDMLREYRSSA